MTVRDLAGHVLGHYRIVELIGKGGMAEVYRARNERLYCVRDLLRDHPRFQEILEKCGIASN